MSAGDPTRRLRSVRLASAVVAVASVLALSSFALAGGHPVTTHTTVTKQIAAAAKVDKTDPPAVPAAAPDPADPTSGTPLVVATPLATSQPVTAASVVVPSTPASATSTTATPTVVTAPLTAAVLPACPIALPTPAQSGGLASLVGLSPLFGPFSAEAFASAAAFQPVLELFGPFLVQFADLYAAAEPTLVPLITQVTSLENAGFSVLSPLYGPYRTQFLTAETTLATALAPYSQALASNPAASCLVDVEGMLTSASPI
jgi:hypothetical protein